MEKPTLSICIPTYNRAKYLDLLLASISTQYIQRRNHLEICISDNASTDSTQSTIKKWQRSGIAIRVNSRTSTSTANENLKEVTSLATGRYIWCLGDDEILESHCLESVFSKIVENWDFIILNSRSYHKDSPDTISKAWFRPESDRTLREPGSAMAFLSAYPGFLSSVIARESILSHKVKAERFVKLGWNHLYNFYSGIASSGASGILIGDPKIKACAGNSDGYDWELYFIEGLADLFASLARDHPEYKWSQKPAKDKILKWYILRRVYGLHRRGVKTSAIVERVVRSYNECPRVRLVILLSLMPPVALNWVHAILGRRGLK